jgi:hypothetical protein
MKQSSIEWVVDQLIEKDLLMIYGKPLEDNDLIEILNQAKAMHKNEIIKAFIYGDASDCLIEDDSIPYAQEYYDTTFNTKEK